MKKALWKGIFCILVALLFMLPVNAGWMKTEEAKETNEFSRMNSIIPYEKKWSRTFGTFFGSEKGLSVDQANDGGYIVLAATPKDWLIKVNSYGIKQWDKEFDWEGGWCVQQTNDGGYIIAGNGISLTKTDSIGNVEWRKIYKSGWSVYPDRMVQQTTDGGYIITGVTDSYYGTRANVWLIKTDSNGNEQWNRTFGGNNRDGGRSVYQTNDGGYIIGGYTYSYGEPHPGGKGWVIKTDENGIEEWNITFHPEDPYDFGYAKTLQQTNDGGYIIGGSRIMKLDSNGNVEWEKKTGCRSIQQTNDGGYIATGEIGERLPPPFKVDLWLAKLDSDGNLEWKEVFGRDNRCLETGKCVRQANDGGYIVVGTKQLLPFNYIIIPLFLDVWVIKTNKIGKCPSLLPSSRLGCI